MAQVYFIKHNRISPIKIGHTSTNVEKRIYNYSTAFPYGVNIVGYIELNSLIDAKKLEVFFHKAFDSNRLNGEWFDVSTKDIIDFCIKNNLVFTKKDKDYYESNIYYNLYFNENCSIKKIAEKTNVSVQSIYKWFNSKNIDTKKNKEYKDYYLLFNQGLSVAEISKIKKVSKQYVYKIKKIVCLY